MSHPKEQSWKIFDAISPSYDRLNRILSLGMDLYWRKKVARFFPTGNDSILLDLATGTADQMLAVRHRIKKGIGIDLSKEMLEIGRRKIAKYPHLELQLADAEQLPFANHSFDVATFSFGIRNVPHVDQALLEIRRVLKPKGRCLILEFSLPKNSLWRAIYLFYLRHFLPNFGKWVSKHPTAYRYLNETIEEFMTPSLLCQRLQRAGFAPEVVSCAGGAVSIYVCHS